MGKIIEHPKPLSKKEWDFWEDRLGFFIQEFDDNIGSAAREAIDVGEGNNNDHFLSGMVQGMWAVYNFVETRMVKSEEGKKSDFRIVEDKPKRKYKKRGKYKKYKKDWRGTIKGRTISESHKQKIKEGIAKYWKKKRKEKTTPGAVIHRKIGEGIRGRVSETMTSMDVVNILKSEPKREFGSKEIFERLVGQGKIPRTRKRKRYMKVVCDRLYFLQSKGVIKKVKKGKKLYYGFR